jgi:aminoglycoside 6'-N-acetyltransferase I
MPSENPEIRPAVAADVPAITSLLQSEPGFWQEHWRRDVLERALVSAQGLALVWEEDGQLLGFICAHDVGFRAYLSELIIAKIARGKGFGTALLQRVEEELSARGCAILISDVWRGAVPFYEALGWSAPDAVLLRKRLDLGRL